LSYKLSGLNPEQQIQLNDGKLLPLMEEFYTIQGEGFNTGKAAYFIRIGGCDVGCHWCDVKESWDASLHPLTTTETILNHVRESKTPAVVITGGEPLIYNLVYLTGLLKQHSIQTYIETSGAYPLSGSWDWICLSPKKTMLPKEENYKAAHELKIIVFNKHDFIWAEEQASKVGDECHLYLQPEWSKRNEITPLIVEYVKNHPKWMISLQTHKYIDIP
jgi:organic radical activating enzyme